MADYVTEEEIRPGSPVEERIKTRGIERLAHG
jgi:hypothetical protein